MMKKKSIFSQISTKPSPNSIKWAGQQVSILSAIFLWGLWLCRVFSLLQISKLIFRKTAKLLRRGSIDKNATRINVPPLFCEIYFILWCALFWVVYVMRLQSPIITVLIYYFLFESVVWVLYYTVFRRFYEENYSIYHELEYLTVLILLIPTQALAFANLHGAGFLEMLSGLLGAGSDSSPMAVKVLGALFAAIVISMIISAFPTEKVKKHKKKEKTFIVGCGDVVKNRLYPALSSIDAAKENLVAYDTSKEKGTLPYCRYLPDQTAIEDALRAEVDESSVVFIAAPTYTHIPYLKAILPTKAKLIVLEKPISHRAEELLFVEKLIDKEEERSRLFFLSYYLLEKALPLTQLMHYNAFYTRYLQTEDEDLLHAWKYLLGSLQKAEVRITEGKDARNWVYCEEYGGQRLETFVHNALLASLFCGLPQHWKDVTYRTNEGLGGAHEISLHAVSGGADIDLLLKKNAPPSEICRYARFSFSGGEIYADLECQTATVYIESLGRSFSVTVKDKYKAKYSIMTDLVMRVKNGECTPEEVDGLKNQLAVTRWLLSLENS